MPVRSGASGECLFQIFVDQEAGFQALTTDGIRYGLVKAGVNSAIIINPHQWYYYDVMSDWVELSEIGWDLFYRLKEKYCPD